MPRSNTSGDSNRFEDDYSYTELEYSNLSRRSKDDLSEADQKRLAEYEERGFGQKDEDRKGDKSSDTTSSSTSSSSTEKNVETAKPDLLSTARVVEPTSRQDQKGSSTASSTGTSTKGSR